MTDPLAPRILRKFLAEQEPTADWEVTIRDPEGDEPLNVNVGPKHMAECPTAGEGCTGDEHLAVAPPGWEAPVKEMKKDKDIDNPWALAWYMKNKGDKPHKEATLAERVAARFVDQSLAARVAARHVRAVEEAAAKKKVKLPQVAKLEDLMVKLPFAVKVLDQKRGDKGSEREVSRLMGEYTDYVSSLRKALDAQLPKDAAHERQKADELLNKIDFFRFGRGTEAHVLDGSLPAAKFEEEFKKVKPIFHELEQLLKGQMVMFANVAMEHPSEAKKQYLKDHPNADPSNHTVKGGGKGGDASAESHKAKARGAETTKHFDEMKSLKTKVENADPSAKKKFDRAYDKLYENGEAATKDAEKLLKKFDHLDEDSQAGAAVKMLHKAVREWGNERMRHHSAKGALAGEKMRQAEQTWSYAKQVDDKIEDLQKALSGAYD
jgi:hypothetical protein